MSGETVSFAAALWRWQGNGSGSWHFVSATGEAAQAISAHALVDRLERGRRRGFGSVKVEARIGDSRWATSVFPGSSGDWILPVKAAIRKAEGLGEGDSAVVELELL